MYQRSKLWMCLLLMMTPFAAQSEAPTDLAGLRECLRSNLPELSMVQNIRLTSKDKGGGRELKARVYGMRLQTEVAVMIAVKAPADMADSRYLVIAGAEKDAMYLYLPALQRTRRVVGSMAGQSLWGTDFSYEDIKLLRGVLNDGEYQFDANQEWAGGKALQVVIKPDAEAESQYTKVDLLVDSERCVIVRSGFHDESGMLKRLTVAPEDIDTVDGKVWARRIVLESVRRNSSSELIIDDYEFDPELRAGLFNPRSFHRGR